MTIALRADASRAVVVLDGVDRVAFNEDGSLELLTPAANPTGNKVMTASQMPFSKEYVSPEQVIVANGPLTLPHGMGVVPKLFSRTLVCKVADIGYAVGDTVDFPAQQDAGASYGLTIVPDTVNLNCRYGAVGNVLYVLHKTTGAPTGITVASWRCVVRAWA